MLPGQKAIVTAQARATLAGVEATPSVDDHGQRTVVLRRGAWTREVVPEKLVAALEELRELQREGVVL